MLLLAHKINFPTLPTERTFSDVFYFRNISTIVGFLKSDQQFLFFRVRYIRLLNIFGWKVTAAGQFKFRNRNTGLPLGVMRRNHFIRLNILDQLLLFMVKKVYLLYSVFGKLRIWLTDSTILKNFKTATKTKTSYF